MGLELATTIKQLEKLWPEPSDDVSQGDDHLRLLKKVLKLIFPGANGEGFAIPITATEEEINYLRGVASNVQEQLNAKGDSSDYVSITGDRMTGDLIVENEIFAVLAFGGVRTGFNVIGPEGVYGGALVYNFPDKTLEIEQTNGQVAALETVATFKQGNIVMSSESFSTDPTDAKSLTTKEYVDSVATGGGGDPGTGAFLPLTGGTLTGVLNCDDFLSIRNASGSTTSVGLNIFDKTTNSIKAFFGWDPITSNLRLAQTEGSIEVADTILDMDGGKVSVTSDSGLSTSATENQHLTTKQYVDNAIASGGTGVEFLPLTGGQLSGNLIVNENVTVFANALNNYPGFDIDDNLGRGLARFIYDDTNKHVGIVQNGSPGSPPDTIAEFFDGKILMTSPAGLNVNNPTLPGHLVTKQYVDGIAGGSGFVSTSGDTMTGALIMETQMVFRPLTTSLDYGILFNNPSNQKNCAVVQDISSGNLVLRNYDAAHNLIDVQMILGKGTISVTTNYGADTILPVAANDLTVKRYVDEFLQVGKGAGLADDMLVNGNYWAKAKVGDESAGFGIQNAAGAIVGGFYQTESNNVVSIAAGPSTGQVHTGINLDEGQAMLFSNTTSITPNTPQSLTTKSYVDSLLAPPLAAIAAAEATIVSLVAQVNALQATVDAL